MGLRRVSQTNRSQGGHPRKKEQRCEKSERAGYISRDFPDGLVVKNPPSKAGEAGLILVRELGSHVPRSNFVHMPELDEKSTHHN